MRDETSKMLMVGCGNMAGAMLAGWLAAGVDPSRFEVLSPRPKDLPDGVRQYREPPADLDHEWVMLGFKPHQLGELAASLQPVAGEGVTVLSLLAGIELDTLAAQFPDAGAHVRVMPNLASRIGKSPVILSGSGVEAQGREPLRAFFDHLGSAMWLEDEAQYNLVTALAGSGPGFVYRFIDALSSAAQELGLDASLADPLALAMVEGASQLAAESPDNPAALADKVASKGGMTREGLNVLDNDKALRNLLVSTLKATADRGAELAKGAS